MRICKGAKITCCYGHWPFRCSCKRVSVMSIYIKKIKIVARYTQLKACTVLHACKKARMHSHDCHRDFSDLHCLAKKNKNS